MASYSISPIRLTHLRWFTILLGLNLPVFLFSQLEAWDGDKDGIPDPWERERALDVNDPTDAWADPDQDGVLNIYEYFLGTNPQDGNHPKFIAYQGNMPLEDFIAQAERGVVLQIPEGVYSLQYNHNLIAEAPRLLIQGGWNADFTERDYCAYPTIFEGQEGGAIFNYLLTEGNSSALILDGIEMRQATSGVIRYTSYLSKVQLLLANCQLIDNAAHRAASILHFEDGDFSLISDLILMNTVIANNKATAIHLEQDANRANFKLLHSLVALNNFSTNDDPPFSSGYGLTFETDSDSLLQMQFANAIIWGNEKADVALWEGIEDRTQVSSTYNIYGFFENDPNAQFFNNPSDQSLNPQLLSDGASHFRIDDNSPARANGSYIGFGPIISTDIGPIACEFPSASAGVQTAPPRATKLYPNPGRETLYLENLGGGNEVIYLQIFNQWGQRIEALTNRGEAGSQNRIAIPIAHLTPACYYLQYTVGDKQAGQFFIKN